MILRTALVCLTLVLAAPAFAANGNAAAGKKKATTCAGCHGADGNTPTQAPDPAAKLAGQYPEYLAKALREYKSGKRKNTLMGGQAQALSEQDIADLAAYYGSLKPQVHDLSSHTR